MSNLLNPINPQLLQTIENHQRIIKRINQSQSLIELRKKLYNPSIVNLRNNINSINSTLPKIYSPIFTQIRDIQQPMIIQSLYVNNIIKAHLKIISSTINPLRENLSTLIDSAVHTYQNTTAEEFEVEFENISIVIVKPKIQEYINFFQNKSISIEMSIRLGISINILFYLSYLSTVMPTLESISVALAKWIIEVLLYYYSEILDLFNPENFAKLTLFHALSIIFNFLKKQRKG